MNREIQEIRARLHWKNRKTYSLVIPPAFFLASFQVFPRLNQSCVIKPIQSENGKNALMVEFE